MDTQQFQLVLPQGFFGVTAHSKPLQTDEAYLAVGDDGLVGGGCFTESPQTASWFNDAIAHGVQVVRGPRSVANQLLGEYLAPSNYQGKP